MSQKTRNFWMTGIVCSGLVFMLALLPAFLRGSDTKKSSPPHKLVVHEWGTFTSFSGTDGINLEFRPLVTNDLPRFVMSAFKQPGSPFGQYFDGSKNLYIARQRMETPVTYFYTDVPRTVNVRVDFPKGMLTEWFPVVKRFDAGKKRDSHAIAGSAFLDWGSVRLIPPAEFASVRLRDPKKEAIPASLPSVSVNDHYGRARETDSAIVETFDINRASHFEKFLFYRGIGNFDLPIKLSALGNNRFEITNTSDEPSGGLLLVRIENDGVRFTRIDPVSPRAAIEVILPESESSLDQLTGAMVHELRSAGLYEKEAVAMVNTWRTSWFGETGTRLLYLVPGKLTDKLLPLRVEPAPDETVRVLVGRLETITPEDGQILANGIAGNTHEPKPTDDAIKARLKQLGRFAEPAIQFLSSTTSDAITRERLNAILGELRSGKLVTY
jgi:hypothetical protein